MPNYIHFDAQTAPVIGTSIAADDACRLMYITGGEGKIIKDKCPHCSGDGIVMGEEVVEVNIPAGVVEGMQLSMRGKGNAGKRNGVNGDLLIHIEEEKHPQLIRDENDLVYSLLLDIPTATLGGVAEIPTIDGKVKLNIPEGTQTGSVFRLKGKGIQYLRGSGRGDQYVTVRVVVPKNLTSEQKELLRKFSASVGETPAKENGHSSIFGKKKR